MVGFGVSYKFLSSFNVWPRGTLKRFKVPPLRKHKRWLFDLQLNNRIYISTRMTIVLWLIGGSLAVLWMLLPIYLIWRDGIGGGLLLLVNCIISIVLLRWIYSFYDVSYDDKYLYATRFKKEKRFDLTEIRRISQGNFQKMNFEIETKKGDAINFISTYSLKLIFNDWPDNLKELERRIGQ